MTKPWKEHKEEIIRLYISEGRTLQDVRGIMRRVHRFEASTRSYRQRFDQWNVGKYNCRRRQERRESFPQPNLPSPPGTPRLRAHGGENVDSSGQLQNRAEFGNTYTVKPEPLQGIHINVMPPPFRSGQPQGYGKADSAPVHRPKDRPAMEMNGWNGERSQGDWAQRVYYTAKKESMEEMSRCSHEQSPFSVNTGQLSPTYLDHKVPSQSMYETDWSMPKTESTPQYAVMPSGLRQNHVHEPERKPLSFAGRHPFGPVGMHAASRPRTMPPDSGSVRRQGSMADCRVEHHMASSPVEFA